MTRTSFFRRIARVMEDIEDPSGIKVRDLRTRVRTLEAEQPGARQTGMANQR